MICIDPSKVLSAYNGTVGCMCGCKGNYKAAKAKAAKAGQKRGYPYNDGDISDRAVQSRINKAQRLIASGEANEIDITDDYIYIEYGTGRVLALYLDKSL